MFSQSRTLGWPAGSIWQIFCQLTIHGQGTYRYTIPTDAVLGSHIWHNVEGAWIDFVVVSTVDLSASLKGSDLTVTVTSHLPKPVAGQVSTASQTVAANFTPGQVATAVIRLPEPAVEGLEPLPVTVKLGDATVARSWMLRTARGHAPLAI